MGACRSKFANHKEIVRDPIFAKSTDWKSLSSWLFYSEIDYEIASELFPDILFSSLGEYFASLKANESFKYSDAIAEILQEKQLGLVVPLLIFAPNKWRSKEFQAVYKNIPYIEMLMYNLGTPLAFIGANLAMQQQQISKRKLIKVDEEMKNRERNIVEKEKPNGDQVGMQPPIKDDDVAPIIIENSVKPKISNKSSLKGLENSAIELMVAGTDKRTDGGISEMLKEFSGDKLFNIPKDLNEIVMAIKAKTLNYDHDANPSMEIKPNPNGDIMNENSDSSSSDEWSSPIDHLGTGRITKEPSFIHWMLPDLHSGNGGCHMIFDDDQLIVNNIMGGVLNKLMANALVGLNATVLEPSSLFLVQIGENENPVSTVEDFVTLLERFDHDVTFEIGSNLTSFGIGLSIKNNTILQDPHITEKGGHSWTQIPLVFPINTNMFIRDTTSNTYTATTLMSHCGLNITIKPKSKYVKPILTMKADWCLNVSGVTGWSGIAYTLQTWQHDRPFKSFHSVESMKSLEAKQKVARLTTTSSICLNFAATEGHGLTMGGYGALGVCADSVAAIQQAVAGTCSLYPLVLGGESKMRILESYRDLQILGRIFASSSSASSNPDALNENGRWKYSADIESLKQAILVLPCDGIVEPKDVISTANRAIACLPTKCIFKAVQHCRRELMLAIEMAEQSLASHYEEK